MAPTAPLVPSVEDFFSFGAVLTSFWEARLTFCLFIPGSKRQSNQHTMLTPCCKGRCFPSKFPVSFLNYPHPFNELLSDETMYIRPRLTAVLGGKQDRNKPKLSSLPGNQLQGQVPLWGSLSVWNAQMCICPKALP